MYADAAGHGPRDGRITMGNKGRGIIMPLDASVVETPGRSEIVTANTKKRGPAH